MKAACLAILVFLLSSCSTFQNNGLPELKKFSSTEQSFSNEVRQGCEQTFFKGQYQFVHSITFQMADGHGATVIGVTVLNGDILKTGLMGVEGFVFFEAVLNKAKQLEVSRALPPFDNIGFASALMRDVQTLFLAPAVEQPQTGILSDGTIVCRYIENSGNITDIHINDDGSREITIYNAERRKKRSITMSSQQPVNGFMVSKTMELKAYGVRGYILHMTLISAEKIKNKKIKQQK